MKHKITIYRFTGQQGFFYIPKKWCEECDLLVSLIEGIIKEYNLEDKVELKIKPWWIWWLIPLIKYQSFHAPMLIIDNKLISAGIVPKKENVLKALEIA